MAAASRLPLRDDRAGASAGMTNYTKIAATTALAAMTAFSALPPAAENARICSFECTFCAACVTLLENVCPNCGGGFSPRPIRPARNHKGDNCTAHYPPSNTVEHRPVDLAAHALFAARLRQIAPNAR